MKINCIANICGLYATDNYLEGELLFILKGKYFKKPDRYTIQIDKTTHILDKMGKYMNHSFEPTCIIRSYEVIALKNIQEGDEWHFHFKT